MMIGGRMPKEVIAVRILMFVVAGLTFVTTLAFLIVVGVGAAALGAALWFLTPGVISLLLALRVPTGGPGLRRGIIALEIFYILLALSQLGLGDPRGLTNLILPAAILVLLFQRAAKQHFSRVAASSYF